MQAALAATTLDGWLVYDFRGLNPHAATVLGMPSGAFLTRRFFVWVPREGQAVVLHNHIEGGTWRSITQDWGQSCGPSGPTPSWTKRCAAWWRESAWRWNTVLAVKCRTWAVWTPAP